MAEIAGTCYDELPAELENLKKSRLFNKDDIRVITKDRKEFEQKLRRPVSKHKEVYLLYIQYEMDLLKRVLKRKSKASAKAKKLDTIYAIANKIKKLFTKAIYCDESDVRLWLSFLKFCGQMKFSNEVSNELLWMTRVHSDKPDFWKLAAQWEYQENKSIKNARMFLLRGLRCHPDSMVLHTEAFHLELLYGESLIEENKNEEQTSQVSIPSIKAEEGPSGLSDLLNLYSQEHTGFDILSQEQELTSCIPFGDTSKGKDETTDAIVSGHRAEFIYESALKKIGDLEFYIGLLKIAQKFSFTTNLQNRIVNDILTKFPDDERTWDVIARRELQGLHYTVDEPTSASGPVPEEEEPGESERGSHKTNLRNRFTRCCIVYQTSLKHVPTEHMASLYLETLLELVQENPRLRYIKKKLQQVFRDLHASGLLREEHYLQWVLHVENREKLMVLGTSIKKFPSSTELWLMYLRFHLSNDEEEAGVNVFNEAVRHLENGNASTLPLWKMMIQYFQTKCPSKVEQKFYEGISQGPAVALPLKPMFIEWLVLVKGIFAARKVYDSICSNTPYCLELHRKMISHECMLPEINLKQVRKCFELACKQFGKSNIEIWSDYINFERKNGDKSLADAIYWKAVRIFNQEQQETCLSELTLNTGLSEPLEKLLT